VDPLQARAASEQEKFLGLSPTGIPCHWKSQTLSVTPTESSNPRSTPVAPSLLPLPLPAAQASRLCPPHLHLVAYSRRTSASQPLPQTLLCNLSDMHPILHTGPSARRPLPDLNGFDSVSVHPRRRSRLDNQRLGKLSFIWSDMRGERIFYAGCCRKPLPLASAYLIFDRLLILANIGFHLEKDI
jgi:hypothetical protein